MQLRDLRSLLFISLFGFVVPALAGVKKQPPAQQSSSYSAQITDKRNQESQSLNISAPKTNQETLKSFSPENIPDFLEGKRVDPKDMMSAMNKMASLKQTAYDFPKESAVFFAGVGGVLLLEMMSHYENNPMAFAQQVESLANPIGHFSFFMFMYANRISMTFWPKLIRNPALWPYLGMTAGMMISDLSSQVLEPLRPCALELYQSIRGKSKKIPQSCSNAYQHLVLKESILELAPSLTSMLMSSWIAGTVQKALMEGLQSKAMAKLTSSPLVWRSINVVSYFAPGKIPAKIGATALNLFQISLFVGVDHKLSPLVRRGWTDLTQGYGLSEITDEVTEELLALKAQHWVESQQSSPAQKCVDRDKEQVCYEGFAAKLLELQEKLAHWRLSNIEPIRMAHGSWNQKLSHLSAAFDGSFSVYNHILNSIVASKQGKESPIDLPDPFNGIKPLMPEPGQEFPTNGYLDGYWQLQNFRKARLKVGAKKIRSLLAQPGVTNRPNQLPPSLQPLESVATLWEAKEEGKMLTLLREFRLGDFASEGSSPEDLKKALSFLKANEIESLVKVDISERSDLQNQQILICAQAWYDKETEKMGQGVALLAKALQPTLGFAKTYQGPVQKIYDAIVSEVGKPEPYSEKGKPYLQNFALHPAFSQYFEVIEYPSSPGRYYLRNPAEYMVYQMICGPDAEAKDSVVNVKWASYDEFVPPMIRVSAQKPMEFCQKDWFGPNHSMYGETIQVLSNEGSKKSFQGVFDYLKSNIRASVLDEANNKNNLKSWWESHVSGQIDKVLVGYAKNYDKIVGQFRELAFSQKISAANLGPIFNSPLWALQQETRLYELILSDMFRDLGGRMDSIEVIPPAESLDLSKDLKNYRGKKLPLFAILRTNGVSDFNLMAKTFPQAFLHESQPKVKEDLALLRGLDEDVTSLILQLAKTPQQGANERETNDKFAAVAGGLEERLAKLREIFDSEALKDIGAKQKAIIDVCLDGIEKNIKELNNYRLIITLMSRDGDSKREDNNCRPSQSRTGKLNVNCDQ